MRSGSTVATAAPTEIRVAAIRAAERLRITGAAPALVAFVKDESAPESVRVASLRALATFSSPQFPEAAQLAGVAGVGQAMGRPTCAVLPAAISAPRDLADWIAGSDPSGGAGLQADLLTLCALGCHPLAVVTAITIQDTAGVDGVMAIDPDWVTDQARLVLEVAVAGMAAEHATSDDLIRVSEEATGMFASLGEPQTFLRHDIEFHRAIAAACGNPILSALVNMVAEQFREHDEEPA